MTLKAWNVVADIGGTNARFGLEDYASTQIQLVKYYSVAEYDDFMDALKHFVDDVATVGGWETSPKAACFAVACPVDGGVVPFTNSQWTLDRTAMIELLGGAAVHLINDFAAVGYAVTGIKPKDWCQIGGAMTAVPNKPIVILGPGTGLGVCTLVPVGVGYQVIEGEGGHVDFAPVDAQEIAVLEILNRRFGRVSAERLLSGAGIVNTYQALAQVLHLPILHDTPQAITEAAISGKESLAVETLEMFCRTLGAVAGNLVLIMGAKGGVYIAGGIAPNILKFIENSGFRIRFESKGRFSDYLVDVPVRVIVKQDLGLFGAAKKLNLLEI